jgi:hypothetical protein
MASEEIFEFRLPRDNTRSAVEACNQNAINEFLRTANAKVTANIN